MGAHKCPSCQAPIEKNMGCNHMSCSRCGYTWCWVCGLSTKHWIHHMSDVMPFSCKRPPNTTFGWICHTLLFLLGFPLLPVFFFVVGIAAGIFGFIHFHQCVFGFRVKLVCTRKNKKGAEKCCFAVLIIYFPFMILFGIALGAAMGALMTTILTLPAYIFHIFFFARTSYWWCKTRTKEDIKS